MDYILAGIANIITALQSPTANAPFAPLSDSHTKALNLLLDILHANVTNDTTALRVPSKKVVDDDKSETPKPAPITGTEPLSPQLTTLQTPPSCTPPEPYTDPLPR